MTISPLVGAGRTLLLFGAPSGTLPPTKSALMQSQDATDLVVGILAPLIATLIVWCVATIWNRGRRQDGRRDATTAWVFLPVLVVGLGWLVMSSSLVSGPESSADTPVPVVEHAWPPIIHLPEPIHSARVALVPHTPSEGGNGGAVVHPPREPRSSQFVNEGLVTAGGRAALIVGEGRGTNIPATARLAKGIDAADSLFKPAFVNEGLFTDAYEGNLDVLKGLGLDSMDMIALGVKSVTVSHDDTVGVDVFQATVQIQVRVIRPSSGFSATIETVRESDKGFDTDRTVENGSEKAIETLIAQLKRIATRVVER